MAKIKFKMSIKKNVNLVKITFNIQEYNYYSKAVS